MTRHLHDHFFQVDGSSILMFLFLRFRAGVKDLEVMVQNLISSAFDTITTVQEGVEILDIFQHLSSREVLWHTFQCKPFQSNS